MIWSSEKGASLAVNDSLVVAPCLAYLSDSNGPSSVSCSGSTCLSEFFVSCVVSAEESSKFELEVDNSAVQSSLSILWLPEGDADLLREHFSYRGKDSLWLVNHSLIKTAKVPRDEESCCLGQLAQWEEREWRRFWGSSEVGGRFFSGLIETDKEFSEGFLNQVETGFRALPEDYANYGVRLEGVGPL